MNTYITLSHTYFDNLHLNITGFVCNAMHFTSALKNNILRQEPRHKNVEVI